MSRYNPLLSGKHDRGYRMPDSMGDKLYCPVGTMCINCPLPVCGHDSRDKTEPKINWHVVPEWRD